VVIAVESMFSMNKAVATISGSRRSGFNGPWGDSGSGDFRSNALARA
jgi:hypothetical protein